MKTLIKNGIIVTSENEYQADLLIEEGKIKEIGKDLIYDNVDVIDAAGKYVLPGGVDQHVHFSFQFNGTSTRGFQTSCAAAAGGTTTVIEFVNQIKDQGLVESVENYRKENADGVAAVDYSFHAVMTDPRPEVIEEIPKLAEVGYPVMKLFMAYKGMFFHADDEAILKALLKAKEAGVTVMVHAENADMIDVLQKQLIAEGKGEQAYVTGDYSAIRLLSESEEMWERRIAVVSNLSLIRKGKIGLAIEVVEKLLFNEESLMHKANGWILREVGKKNNEALIGFLDKYSATMPRTTLRYSLERQSADIKAYYMSQKSNASNIR